MKERVIYTFTFEKLQEFKNNKKENDFIITCFDISNDDNHEDINNYYVDISNLYKSNIENNPILIENILNKAFKQNKYYIMLNENLKIRFKQDFSTSFDTYKNIQTIYQRDKIINNSLISMETETVKIIKRELDKNLIGHNVFKEDFIKELQNFPILYKLNQIKIFSILICGNPGVGKTEVARILHNGLYPDSKMIKINLGNYNTQGALNSLIGSPKGFFGSERGGELSNKIRNSYSKIILIDEFEKANNDIFNFFYEMLEDGKFTDLAENEFDVNGYIIIFTTNLSKDNYKNVLPAPLLSRFTMKFLFENPNNDEKIQFVNKKINNLLKNYKQEKIDPQITPNQIKKNIDYSMVNQVEDFRIINRMISNALIKAIEDGKQKNMNKREKSSS